MNIRAMTSMSWRWQAAVAAMGVAVLTAGPAAADPGVSDDAILFGQSAAFGGPAKALGTGMRQGLQAAFQEVNANGGVLGRKLELVTYDDGYEPDRAIDNTNKLIDEDKVFALIGEVGTPTSKAAQPIAKRKAVPFIAPFTGASFLRKDSNRHVINVRASYCQEAEAWIEHLTQDLGAKDIALLYQDDSYGRVGLTCVTKALEKRDMSLVEKATYARNTKAVKRAVLTLREADPDAVTMVGAYEPVAEFIKLGKKLGMDVPYVNISFVGSKALADALGEQSSGVIISQVVPFPWSDSLALAKQYRSALAAAHPDAEAGFVSFEGYIAGRVTAKALASLDEGNVTREALLDAFYDLGSFEMGGVSFEFGEGDNQGLDDVFLTVVQKDGSFKAVQSLPEG